MFHPTAIVETSDIGSGTRVWAFAHVLPGARIGCNVNVGDHAFVEGGAVIGNNVTLKNAVCVWSGITIEDDVFVGPNVTFTNDRYPRSPRMEAVKSRYSRMEQWLVPTRVGRGCSIGASATICPGLVLGEFSMIAAGAVVTHDVPPFCLVAGVPAQRKGDVCTCGQVLSGKFDACVCKHCGESPEQRVQRLSAAQANQ